MVSDYSIGREGQKKEPVSKKAKQITKVDKENYN
jgi:hypothetical protein